MIVKIWDTSDAFSRVAVTNYIYDVFLKNADVVAGSVNYEPMVIYNFKISESI